MIYSLEKVPDTLKAWMSKAINFHWQKAHIITLKKEHSLPLSFFFSNSHPTKDPNAMDVDAVCLKKLSPADQAHCIREGLCFRCCKKGHSTNECRSTQPSGKPKAIPRWSKTLKPQLPLCPPPPPSLLSPPLTSLFRFSPPKAKPPKTSSKHWKFAIKIMEKT